MPCEKIAVKEESPIKNWANITQRFLTGARKSLSLPEIREVLLHIGFVEDKAHPNSRGHHYVHPASGAKVSLPKRIKNEESEFMRMLRNILQKAVQNSTSEVPQQSGTPVPDSVTHSVADHSVCDTGLTGPSR